MTPYPDRLSPEERDLAARLARIGPHGEPPAALDARILSAAHAAVAAPPARRKRWPAWLGVAATLALAIGVTWQLRPRPDAAPVLQEGPMVESPAPQSATGEAVDAAAGAPSPDSAEAVDREAAAAAAEPPTPRKVMVPPPRAAAPTKAPRDDRAPSPGHATVQRAVAPAPAPRVTPEEARDAVEPPSFSPAPAPLAAPAPVIVASPPPPPSPPSPPAPASRTIPAPAAVTVTGSGRAAERASSAPSTTATAAQKAQSQQDLPLSDGRAAHEVPIQEDARLDAHDWLERIRLRMAADDVAGARASLALFRRYYPERAIPEDLAPLAQ